MEKYKTQVIRGTKYAYIDKPYWNPKKKRGEHLREYIGKVVDDVFVPNKRFILQQELEKQNASNKPGPVPATECKRLFYGATYLFDKISEQIGITSDLNACFGNSGDEIRSLAFYLLLEEGQAMYRFKKWSRTHWHPSKKEIISQRISEIFGEISEKKKLEYFKRQSKRCSEKEYLAFDTTSISSYSRLISQVKYGKNKENDDLPQINLALLYGETSRLPVYYRKLSGNIPDVKTVENLIKDIDFLEIQKINMVFDRGFYSAKNINEIMKHHHKFLIGTKLSLKLVSEHLDTDREEFITRKNYNADFDLYIKSYTENWNYTEDKPRLKKAITENRRVYIHIFYNDQHCTDDRNRFNKLISKCEDELRSNSLNIKHDYAYKKYFEVSDTPIRGKKIIYNEDAIRLAEKNFGYFALMSNGIKDPVEALKIYRLRDTIEKSFHNLKDRLSMRRMSVSSEENLEGKLFVQFISLEILSYIKMKMEINNLYKNYTMQSLLDELDTIEFYQQPGRAHHLSEITEKQNRLYELMGVKTPA